MKSSVASIVAAVIVGLACGCSYFNKPEPPPPLPPIEEPSKPPLEQLKGEYFDSFPWKELPKPLKDGTDPQVWTYTFKEGDTLETVAEKQMGDPALAAGLAEFNDISATLEVPVGDKILVPYPIVGISSKIIARKKGERSFGEPLPFDTLLDKGDRYKLRFEPNVNGYLYVLKEDTKDISMLYPAKARASRTRRPRTEPLMRDTGKVTAHEPVLIPLGKEGVKYDPRRAGDKIHVFFSLRPIAALEELKEKKKITPPDIEDVMNFVKEEKIYTEPPYRLLRISDPDEILGFSLTLSG